MTVVESTEPTGMAFANKANAVAVGDVFTLMVATFGALRPSIEVSSLRGNETFVCGDAYPSFETRILDKSTGRTVYVHTFTQGKTGNACERAHRYFSIRSDLRAALNPGDEICVLWIPYREGVSEKYKHQLQRAAALCGSHPTLGYLCSNDRTDIVNLCVEIARYLGDSVPSTSIA